MSNYDPQDSKHKASKPEPGQGGLFDGKTYSPKLDESRLLTVQERVQALMVDGAWRTLSEINTVTGGSEASVSARLRDMRKERHGYQVVERRRRGEPSAGLWEYRVLG